MRCPNCESDLSQQDDEIQFCPYCGAALDEDWQDWQDHEHPDWSGNLETRITRLWVA